MYLLPKVEMPFGLCGMSEEANVIPRELLATGDRRVEHREDAASTLLGKHPAFRVTSRAVRATSTLELDMVEQRRMNV